MSDLKELLERVEGATGADPALDGLIATLVLQLDVWEEPVVNFHTGPSLLTVPVMGGKSDWVLIPAWTASIDAALTLAERMLPDLHYELGHGRAYWATVEGADSLAAQAEGATLPLAILAALLKALRATGHPIPGKDSPR